MASGGSRAKSGPAKDPNSRTSERAGVKLTKLPAAGHKGRAPALTTYIPKPNARHKIIWSQLWKTPQAAWWSQDSWKWSTVARLTHLRWRCESVDTPAALFNEVIKLETELALNEPGLRYHGLTIARDEVAAKRGERDAEPAGPSPTQRRLRKTTG